MSITKLQQARQMYAMGKKVERIAFGGGGSYSDLGGYQGKGGAATGGSKGSKAGGAGTGIDGQGGTGGPDREDSHPFNTGPDPVVTELDVKEQYAVNNPVTLGKPIPAPDFTKVGPGSTQHDNYIDRMNLQGSTYQPLNLPTLAGGVINFLGGLGFEKNKNFFLENVAGKYGFGYGMDAYKDYMRKRSLGEIQAYGRPLTAEELRNQVGGGDGGNNNTGIMTVNNTVSDDADGDGDVDQDDFVFRYFDKTGKTLQAGAGGVQDLMTQIRKRISNIFS